MIDFDGKHEGDLSLTESINLNGMIVGSLHVTSGNSAIINGTVTGHVFVEPRGTLKVYGVISGGITNNGGDIEIFGMVSGGLYENAGSTLVHPHAAVS